MPVNSRTALTTTTLPTGGGPQGTSPVLIRKGTAVGYCPYLIHRRKDLYGDDAHLFRPERWADGLEKSVGWGYIPFNGGPRVCLGRMSSPRINFTGHCERSKLTNDRRRGLCTPRSFIRDRASLAGLPVYTGMYAALC